MQTVEGSQKHRKKPTYGEVDLTKPVSKSQYAKMDKELYGDTCFGREWDMETRECQMCHDSEMCGLICHTRLKKMEAKLDQEVKKLDTLDFDGIKQSQLFMWLKAEQRTSKELLEKVKSMSNCTDPTVIKAWTISFIKADSRLSVQNKLVLVR